MRAERPILLRFLNVLTSLNDFIIKRIVFLFLVKYIASGTLRHTIRLYRKLLLTVKSHLVNVSERVRHLNKDIQTLFVIHRGAQEMYS